MREHRRTKIVATLGPASFALVSQLLQSGVNVVRLNFSHGTHEEHHSAVSAVRDAALKQGIPVAVFGDLSGPKVRIGPVAGEQIVLEDGKTIELRRADGSVGTPQAIFTSAFDPAAVFKPGEPLLLSDGLIELRIERITPQGALCRIAEGGELRSRSGMLAPHSAITIPSITPKDLSDISFAIGEQLDYLALSFVRSADDVRALRSHLNAAGAQIPVISKIETARALEHLEAIVADSDGVMVARGDLGIELALERVPPAQRRIIRTANELARPVITATQLLRSMVTEARPTRAEVSDVFTAVREGTDAVMLSEETTIGKHPVLTVQILDRILREAEAEFSGNGEQPSVTAGGGTVADATCLAAKNAAQRVGAEAIVVCTESGSTARLMAKYRPLQPIFAPSVDAVVRRRLSLVWGVNPWAIELRTGATTEDEIRTALSSLSAVFAPRMRVVVTVGTRAVGGSTSIMQIREFGE